MLRASGVRNGARQTPSVDEVRKTGIREGKRPEKGTKEGQYSAGGDRRKLGGVSSKMGRRGNKIPKDPSKEKRAVG